MELQYVYSVIFDTCQACNLTSNQTKLFVKFSILQDNP